MIKSLQKQKLIKKLHYSSNHRGIKELDIILGDFSSKYLPNFNYSELMEYDYLLSLPDQDIYLAFIKPNKANNFIKNLSIFKIILTYFNNH